LDQRCDMPYCTPLAPYAFAFQNKPPPRISAFKNRRVYDFRSKLKRLLRVIAKDRPQPLDFGENKDLSRQ
jgi:hypothetical protein